jgi:large subunit ribosomal protein L5e
MPFVKVVKNAAYYKRFQVKYKRRREGKTDYRARKRLIHMDKNKYGTPKYRLVVRRTNTDIICQIVHATLSGDRVLTAAYSHELKGYGMSVGLTNYAAAYATGLLCARRLLKKLGLDGHFAGNSKVDGSDYNIENDLAPDAPSPFVALLDVGLAATTTGNRVFGAMKGACDGGLAVPHSENRFPGYDKEKKELDTNVHRQYIFAEHVGNYMESLKSEDKAAYEQHFSRYIKAGLAGNGLAAAWKKVHANIRAKPEAVKKAKKTGMKHYPARPAKLSAGVKKHRATIKASQRDARRRA